VDTPHLTGVDATGDLPLVNADFEAMELDEDLTRVRPSARSIDGWTTIGKGNISIYNPSTRHYGLDPDATQAQPMDPPGVSGSNVAYIASPQPATIGIEQATPHLAHPAVRYELRVAVGHRTQNLDAAGYQVQLLAGDEVIGVRESEQPPGPPGRFTDVLVATEPLSSSDPRVGRSLTVRFLRFPGAGGYLDVDNVRLRAVVPASTEPAPNAQGDPR